MNYSLIKSHTVDEVSHLSLNFIVQQLISERYEVKKKIVYRFFCRLHESQSPWHSLISSCVTHAATTTKFQCTLWLSR